ncbi:MAG: response regulator [Verrucomicrobiota bacterium]|jgi:HD-like signal output (HDOD) protein
MKRCIYVVDDQAPVMETAVLILRSIDGSWEVTGFKDPLQALAAVRAKAPDLILSDQIMPQMQGSQLLEQVRAISPDTIRIIMSGYVALNKLTLITSAHQYIAKPFDTAKLRESVRRSFAAQERIADKGLQGVVTSLRSIPSLPQVYHSLLAELEDNRSAASVIARTVAEDAGLSTKVLQLANSPLFGQDYLITSPIDAVMCLGTDMIAAVVMSQALFRHYESLANGEKGMRKVWSHCWETAYLAQHICREKRVPRKSGEEAFLAALLHEMGRFILVDNFPDQFQAACDAARQTNSPLVPRLRESFHTSPSQITAYILELWGMPAGVIGAVAMQDDPGADQANGFSIGSALYIADGIASRRCPPDSFGVEDWKSGYLQSIGCLEDIPAWEKLSLEQKSDAGS